MITIQWDDLPPDLRDHLFERAAERKIKYDDIVKLAAWRRTSPRAPEGPWFKDFGSFRLARKGAHPKTFLLAGQVAYGEEVK